MPPGIELRVSGGWCRGWVGGLVTHTDNEIRSGARFSEGSKQGGILMAIMLKLGR